MAVERSKSSIGRRAMKQLGVVVLRWTVVAIFMIGLVPAAEVLEDERAKSSLGVIEVKVRNLYPEGFDWDAKHSRFLVGSMAQGKLVTVTQDGAVEDFVEHEEDAGTLTLGVTVDPILNRVLAVVQKSTGPNRRSSLAAYDLDSKKRTLFVNLFQEEEEDTAENVVANDVAVDSEGNAYVTNSGGNSMWKVTVEGVKSVFVASVPQLPIAVDDEFVKTVTTNGIVFHQEGYLLVSQSNSGAILRVRLADKEMTAVKITNGALAAVMPGADGMAWRSDGSLVVVSVHTSWLLSSRDSWRSATLIDQVPLDTSGSTTGVTVKGLDVFVIHSHFAEFFKGLDWDSFKILKLKFTVNDDNNPLWLLAIVGIVGGVVLLWKLQLTRFNKDYTKKRV